MKANQILIDDRQLGRTQRAVLKYAIAHHSRQQLEIIWTSHLDLNIPRNWQVKAEVALSLAAKLWVLTNPDLSGKILYLDGNYLWQGQVDELLPPENFSYLQVARGEPLGKLHFFLVNREAAEGEALARQLQALAAIEYGKLADFEGFPRTFLPREWFPTSFGENPAAKVIDCLPLGERPWYSAFAPSGSLWFAQLQEALAADYLSLAAIRQDVVEGLVRPSLLAQVEGGINPWALPPSVRESDREFVPPELFVSPEQVAIVNSTIFPLPKRKWHRVLFSSYFIEVELPNRWQQIQRLPQLPQKIWQKLTGGN